MDFGNGLSIGPQWPDRITDTISETEVMTLNFGGGGVDSALFTVPAGKKYYIAAVSLVATRLVAGGTEGIVGGYVEVRPGGAGGQELRLIEGKIGNVVGNFSSQSLNLGLFLSEGDVILFHGYNADLVSGQVRLVGGLFGNEFST